MELQFVPLELARWDEAVSADVVVAPIWTDVRPLRGAAGLLDWRLCGRLSHWLREGRLDGSTGEKLLVPTTRLPWRAILLVGVGQLADFSELRYREALSLIMDTLRRMNVSSAALSLPTSDAGPVGPRRALQLALEAGAGVIERLIILDRPAVLKTFREPKDWAARVL